MPDYTLTENDLNPAQLAALNKLRRLLGHHSIPDGDRFHVASIVDVLGRRVMIHGNVCKDPANVRWFETHYSFIVGPRGAVTMVDGPKWMNEPRGSKWCGINIDIR